jgi:hypothetical protein
MWDHVKSVFEKSAHKLVSQSISNGRICASSDYMQMVEGQQMGSFRDGSDMNVIEEQYVMVKHIGLNFISYFISIISNVQLNVCMYLLFG